MSLSVKYLPAAALALAACATGSSAGKPRTAPDLGPVNGGIAWFTRDDYLSASAAWRDGDVVAGPRGGPVTRHFTREVSGRWTGAGEYGLTVELAIEGSRITGPTVDGTFTRVDGGFRLSGRWFRRGVDLGVNGKEAGDHQMRYVRDASGAYVSTDLPGPYIYLVGDADRLEDPRWPEVALAALLGGWGVA